MDEINKREFRALVRTSEVLRRGVARAISWDLEDEVEGLRIKITPLWRWLLTG
ncbi:hypothetical protein [Vulcanisaeta sp. JCM 16159]|uniref:hypothetical protein n=1 Tax=Vulcanisaeta sp. JCM 16159 TaxID=1295371 RepID=UPI000A51A08A|nr:hypothetical protein [Vulcanisaeta sp. JCM 16159]